MKLKINWKYRLNDDGEERTFSQTVKINLGKTGNKVTMPSYGMGTYLANLYSACNIDGAPDAYRNSPAFAAWKNIVGKSYFAVNGGEARDRYVLADSIAYPAFCIFKNLRTALQELTQKETQNNGASLCTRRIFGEKLLNAFDNVSEYAAEIQKRIDGYLAKYNGLLLRLSDSFDREFYDALRDCLEAYSADSDLAAEYFRDKGGRSRCFATFVADTGEKYVSFSGFFDAEDPRIIAWCNGSDKEAHAFVTVAKSICASLRAEFVPINLKTRRYVCRTFSPITVEQGDSLGDLIREGVKNQKNYYSCCERKIFGRFDDNTPNGTLYVKMKICGECSLGLAYQMRGENEIVLFDGLGY